MIGLSNLGPRRWIVVGLLSVLLAPTALAGTSGTLTGVIRDRENRQPLPGVTVFVEGTKLGAIADEQGRYRIINVPAGHYRVRAKIVGYNDYIVNGVEILPDFTREQNMDMVSQAMQMQPVEVQATRPLIQRDATGTARFIGGDEIQNMPVRSYREAAAQQAGIVNFQQNIDRESQNQNTLIVRGGRPNETAYYVDGFSQQDPLTGTTSTNVNRNAIQEVAVLTGGFNPEYGRIMSGVVNVVTREGEPRYFGTLEGVSDFLSGSWVGTHRTDYNTYNGSLGGPVLPGKQDLTFFVSGERRWQRDRSPSFMSPNLRQALRAQGLDPDFKPNNSSLGTSWQGKLAWRISDAMNLKAGTLGSLDNWREYYQIYLFDLAHTPRYKDRNESYFATFTATPSKNTFWSLGGNWFATYRRRTDGTSFNDLSPKYVTVNGDTIAAESGNLLTDGGYYQASNPRYPSTAPLFWNSGHVWDDFLQRYSKYQSAQGNLTSQVNRYHQIKVGGDFQYHTLRYLNHLFPVQLGGDSAQANLKDYDAYGYDYNVTYRHVIVANQIDSDGDGTLDQTVYTPMTVVDKIDIKNVDSGRDGAKHPKIASLYLQDRYEREGVIVNGGLRFDYINSSTPALANERLPLGNAANDTTAGTLTDARLKGNTTYKRVSPRLGIAFPVDEKTLLRFNYGQFFQQPNLQDLYVSYRYLQYKVGTGGYFFPVGNPNLRPERTTAYEAGVARQLGDHFRIDGTLYWKDVKDLVQIENQRVDPGAGFSFTTFRNTDYATIKGLDVGFEMRPMHHVSAQVNYSLSVAKGTGSVSLTRANQAWTADQTPKQITPLAYDERHRLAVNVDWRFARNEGPALGNLHIFSNAGLNALLNVDSGTPYTPSTVYNEISLAALAPEALSTENSRIGPWTINLDLKADKGFRAGGVNWNAYVWVLNVLDRKNAVQVYTSSGEPNTTGYLNTLAGQQFLADAASAGLDGLGLYRLAENDPNFYSNPRLVRFGLRANF